MRTFQQSTVAHIDSKWISKIVPRPTVALLNVMLWSAFQVKPECPKCGKVGHMGKDCTSEPVCRNCGESGDRALEYLSDLL